MADKEKVGPTKMY